MKTLLVGAVAASVLVAMVVTGASLRQTPQYEASALVMVGGGSPAGNGKIQLIPRAPAPESLRGFAQTMAIVIDSRPVAKEAIRRLGLEVSPDRLLNNLTVEPVEDTQFLQLSYTDADPHRAQEVVNAVGRVSSERISVTSGANSVTATLYDKASVSDTPASPKPLRNGLVALMAGLALSAAFVAGREFLRRRS